MTQYPDAEEALLGSMMVEPWATRRGLHVIAAEDFGSPKNKAIFETIQDMAAETGGRGIDTLTVTLRLAKDGKLDQVGGKGAVFGMLEKVGTAGHIEYYARYVREASLERQLDVAFRETEKERTPKNVKKLGDLILALQGNRGVSIFDMREDLGPMLDEIFEKPEKGLRTGMPGIDELMGPIKPGDLWTIAARPGGGKTALMLKLAAEMAVQEIPVLYLTTEMKIKELVQRLLPMATGIPHSKFRAATFTAKDRGVIMDASAEMSLMPLKLAQKGRLSLDDIRGAILQAKPQVVFVDYLQRCHMPKAENMAYMIAEFYVALKEFLLDVGVSCFIGCQSDRDLDRNPTVAPMMAHLKGSGGIEAESDGVGMLWEPPAAVIEKRHDWIPPKPGCRAMEFWIRKNRNGDTNVVADLELNGQLIKMSERTLPVAPRQEEILRAENYRNENH